MTLISHVHVFAQIGIGTDQAHESAALEIFSDQKGLLISRVSLSNNLDVTTIPNPAVGLLVYNTSISGSQNNSVKPGFYYWSGLLWIKLFVEGDIDLSIADDAVTSSKIADGTITSADINASAAIPFSKLSLVKSDIEGLGIPGVDTNTTLSTATLSGTTLVLTDSVSNTYTVDLTSIDTDTNTTYTAGSGLVLSGTSFRLADEAIFSGTVTANYFVGDGSNLTGVSATSIADDAVTSSKIADGTITSADINASAAIVDTKLATISTSGKVANSATTATSSNTASSIVSRDVDGNFQATDISLSGSISGGDSSSSKISGFSAHINAKTSNYTLLVTDNGQFLKFDSSSATTLTIPTGLPIGFNCTVIQYGTGQVTFTGTGTTLKNRSNLTKTAGQYSMVSIVSVDTNIFVLSGEMSN